MLALLAFPESARALGDHIGFEGAPWVEGLDGKAAIDGDILAGSTIDFTDTLGLERNQTTPIGRLWFRWAKTGLILDLSDSSRSGSEVLAQSIAFNDMVYAPSETLTTDFDLRLLQAKLRHSFIDLKVVEFGVDIGATIAQVDMHLDGSVNGLTTFNESIPFPTVGAAVIIKPVPGFHIRAEADGLSVTIGGDKVRILDARVQLEQSIGHFLNLFGGYRSYRFVADGKDFGSVETTFKGAYAGLGAKF
jgi:hypothetical protein